jgi:hypothetical protein
MARRRKVDLDISEKPGWKSTEFIHSMIASLAGIAIIVLPMFTEIGEQEITTLADNLQKLVGMIMVVIPNIGYVTARTKLKMNNDNNKSR